MADDLRNQTYLKDGLLDSRVGSCDLFGGVDGNLRKVRSSSSGSSIGIMHLENSCYLLYENIDPHSLGAAFCLWQGCMWSSSPFGSDHLHPPYFYRSR